MPAIGIGLVWIRHGRPDLTPANRVIVLVDRERKTLFPFLRRLASHERQRHEGHIDQSDHEAPFPNRPGETGSRAGEPSQERIQEGPLLIAPHRAPAGNGGANGLGQGFSPNLEARCMVARAPAMVNRQRLILVGGPFVPT